MVLVITLEQSLKDMRKSVATNLFFRTEGTDG
jgi:hypothetical protein